MHPGERKTRALLRKFHMSVKELGDILGDALDFNDVFDAARGARA